MCSPTFGCYSRGNTNIKIKKQFLDLISIILLTGFYCYSITLSVISTTLINVDNITLILLCLFFVAYFVLLTHNKICALITGGITAVSAAVFVFVSWMGDFKILGEYVDAIIDVMFKNTLYSHDYDWILLVLICLLFALFSVAFTVKWFSVTVAALTGTAIFAVEWATNYYYNKASFILFLAAVMLLVIKKFNTKSFKRTKLPDEKKALKRNAVYTVSLVPLVAVIVLISFIFSSSGSGSSGFIKAITSGNISSFADLINMLGTPDHFSISSAGFGSRSSLGGDVRQDDTHIMDVAYSGSILYLSGAKSDIYTGTRWENSKDKFEKPELESIFGGMFSFYNFTENKEFKMMSAFVGSREESILIFPKKNLRVMFHPAGTTSVSDEFISMNGQGDIRSDTYYGLGEDYRVNFAHRDSQPYPLSLGFYEQNSSFEQGWTKGLYREMNRQSRRVYNGMINLDLDMLIDYSDSVYEDYLSLPKKLPERVKTLAGTITQGIDEEQYFYKAQTIVSFLQRYKYTLTPGTVPADRDFTDYFLFDKKEGYCTYFATALSVLCRAEGIPTRYVEGYVTPSVRNPEKRFSITNEEAHAWVEAYFEGIGWMILEATPPNNARLARGDFAEPDDSPASSASSQPPSSSQSTSSENVSYVGTDSFIDMSGDDGDGFSVIQKFLIIVFMLILLVSAVMMLVSHRKIKLAKLKTAPYIRMMSAYYGYILALAAFDGAVRLEHETALMFGRRVAEQFTFGDMDMITAAELYTAAKYKNPGTVSEREQAESRNAMTKYYEYMYDDFRKKKSWYLRLKFFVFQTFSVFCISK